MVVKMEKDKTTNSKVDNEALDIIRESIMYIDHVLDANTNKSNFAYLPFVNENKEIEYNIIFNNGSLWSRRAEEKREYTKFLDYRGKNLLVSRKQLSIGQLKGYATLAYEKGVEGKVIEIDKGAMFIIGNYVSKDQGELNEEHRTKNK